MGLMHEGYVLPAVAQEVLRTLDPLRRCSGLELVEAEVDIPFVRTVPAGVSSGGSGDFGVISLLAEDIRVSAASDIWWLRISIAENRAPIVRVERV